MNSMLKLTCLLEGRSTSRSFPTYMGSNSRVFDLEQHLLAVIDQKYIPRGGPRNTPILWITNLGKVRQASSLSLDSLPDKKRLWDPTQPLSTLPQGTAILVQLAQKDVPVVAAASGPASSTSAGGQSTSEAGILKKTLPDLMYDRYREPSNASTISSFRRVPMSVKNWSSFRSAATSASKKCSTEQKFDDSEFRFVNRNAQISDETSLASVMFSDVLRLLNDLLAPEFAFVYSSATNVAGRPDFVGKTHPYQARVLIEVKTKWVLGCEDLVKKYNNDIASIAAGLEPRNPIWPYVLQMFLYLSLNRLRYGVLTTYEQTWFLRRDEGVLHVSPAIRHHDTLPTVLQCYKHIVDLANEDHISAPAPLTLSLNGQHVRRQDFQKIDSNKLEAQESLGLQQVDLGEFELQEVIGEGRSGRVFRAFWRDKPVALKICDLYKNPKYEEEILTEVAVYQALESLQGIYVPRLRIVGYDGGLFAFAMDMAGSPVEVESLSDADRLKIVQCLTEIHRHGILHNDIRRENILVCRESGRLQVRFIDFASSKAHSNEHEMEREMTMLRRLLEMD
ncbi:hypothetical protein EMPS_10758 [Entomortierella parvispora]|uniref:Protein kinase domain-containing protein n=1 Tax=Entomortierella parvispora TaxID=205924 RepID=A0A9P3M1H4_9FUNG|nr:hypothetical protein EMPS_10758 [Entomortierella parvispora]